MENQQKATVGLQTTEPNLLYQKPTNHARRTPMEFVSITSGRNQTQESRDRSSAQALSRAVVPVSMPQVRPVGVCSFSKTLQS